MKRFSILLVLLLAALPASAQRLEPVEELEGVGITEHLGGAVPMDLEFVDDEGRTVTLGDYFDGTRPVILTMNYSSCPMLCSLHLNGLVDGMKELPLSIGEEFEVVTVSLDPLETTTLARKTKQRYLSAYGREGAGEGWHFLTGKQSAIRALADTIGFGYRYVETRKEYAHTAATFVLAPEGTLSRYLYGVIYEPKTLRLSLVEASEGKIGSTIDRLILFCFHYDATEGRYGPAAIKIMQAGGGLTLLVLGLGLLRFWRREVKTRREKVA